MNSKQLGIFGERIASNYLIKKDYKILETNYSPHHISGPRRGEIDIIAKKDNTFHFVEVKTLAKTNRGQSSGISPEMKVNISKRRKILKTAESWLREKKIPLALRCQIDVISIIIDLNSQKAKARHFKNV